MCFSSIYDKLLPEKSPNRRNTTGNTNLPLAEDWPLLLVAISSVLETYTVSQSRGLAERGQEEEEENEQH